MSNVVEQLQQEKKALQHRLDKVERALAILSDTPAAPAAGKVGRPRKKKRTMPASAIERIRAYQKARWAKIHAAQAKAGKK
jgi:hypothetical protein